MRSPIDNIPTEIIQAIIDEVPASSPDLLSLRTVDRLLHRMATPNAFRRIRVGNNLTEVKGLKSIQESRDISKLVEQLIFDDRNDHEFNVGPHRNDCEVTTPLYMCVSILNKTKMTTTILNTEDYRAASNLQYLILISSHN